MPFVCIYNVQQLEDAKLTLVNQLLLATKDFKNLYFYFSKSVP